MKMKIKKQLWNDGGLIFMICVKPNKEQSYKKSFTQEYREALKLYKKQEKYKYATNNKSKT